VSEARGAVILAVEDEPRNAALLHAILEPAGYVLHVATDLAAAREWLATSILSPALVLLDRHLPDGDGLELIPDLRMNPATRGCPIVLVSASVLPEDRVAAANAGCDAFMAKPLRVGPLLDEIRTLVAS
jgi:CheY-like chemotaxis protein